MSVIIPVYNRADTVGRAIRSVLEQGFGDLELLVVDDASTDATVATVQSFTDPRLELLRHRHNRNGSAARNTGIRRASGEFIAFLDSDDEWLLGKLERQVDLLEELPDETGVAYTGHTFVSSSGEESTVEVPFHEGDVFSEYLYRPFFHAGSTALVRAGCFERAGLFDERLPRHQDWEMFLRLARRWEFACIPEPLVRVHFTGQPDPRVVERAKRIVMAKLGEEIAAQPFGRRRAFYGRQSLELGRRYRMDGRRLRAVSHYLAAVLQDPRVLGTLLGSVLRRWEPRRLLG